VAACCLHCSACTLLITVPGGVLRQVHPSKLTAGAHGRCRAAAGARLLLGTVTGVKTDDTHAITAVQVQQQQSGPTELPAGALVLAMGPWTGAAQAWLPSAPATTGQEYHSVVLRPRQPASDTCVFTAFQTADGRSIRA